MADDAQDLAVAVCRSRASVSSRGLCQRLVLSQLLEQPHVLDRDHAWSAKVWSERDLLSENGPGSVDATVDRADGLRPRAASARRGRPKAARLGLRGDRRTRDHRRHPGCERRARRGSLARSRLPGMSAPRERAPKRLAPSRAHVAERRQCGSARRRRKTPGARVARPRRSLGDRVEHGLHVRRRAADHPQDLARRRLLLQRLRRVA